MLRITIETMTGCLGGCDGCVFTIEERHDRLTMTNDIMNKSKEVTAAWVKNHQKKGRDLFPLFFTCVQADHLLIPEDQVDDLSQWMLDSTAGVPASYEFTTSLVGKPERVRSMLNRFYDSAKSRGIYIMPAPVYSPTMAANPKFGEAYIGNFEYAKRLFGGLALAFNFGQDILSRMSAQEYHNLVISLGVSLAEPALTPTVNTADSASFNWPEYVEWLKQGWDTWSQASLRYDLFYAVQLSGVIRMMDGVESVEMLERIEIDLMSRPYIDKDGNGFFTQSGFTGVAVPLFHRTGFSSFANVNDGPELFIKKAEQDAKRLAKIIYRQFFAKAPCIECQFNKVCANSGAITPIRLSKIDARFKIPDSKQCPSGIKTLLQHIKKDLDKGLKFPGTMPFEFIKKAQGTAMSEDRFLSISSLEIVRTFQWLISRIDLDAIKKESGENYQKILMAILDRSIRVGINELVCYMDDICLAQEIKTQECSMTADEAENFFINNRDRVTRIMETIVKPAVEPYGYTVESGYLYHRNGKDDYNQKPLAMNLPFITKNAEEIVKALNGSGYAD